jgi:serine/threonine protein kinase
VTAATAAAATTATAANSSAVAATSSSAAAQQQQSPAISMIAAVTPIGVGPSLVQVVGVARPPASPAPESQYSVVPVRTNSTGVSDDAWRIDKSEIAVGEEIGRGNFGRVLRGEWRGMQVAIKRMALDVIDLDPKQRADFARECAVLAKLRPHRNLVAFLGVTLLDDHDAIVLDFCGGGSLEAALLDPAGGGSEWTLDDKLAIAHDCAAGLTHLHREGIVHRDIAARNVLLDSFPFIAKLSDFGMSRVIQDRAADHFTATRVAPARWSAPETIEKGAFSLRSDVFMFSVLLYEIFERQKPWALLDPTNAAFEVLSGRRMTLSTNVPPRVAQIMQVCWAHDPNSRPRMEDTLAQIKSAWTNLHSGRQ